MVVVTVVFCTVTTLTVAFEGGGGTACEAGTLFVVLVVALGVVSKTKDTSLVPEGPGAGATATSLLAEGPGAKLGAT